MTGFLLLSMIFCHVIADYNLQGILAQMKQKEWWETNYPNFKYKNDYKTALLMHSLSWAFFIEIPLYIYFLSYNPSTSLKILNILVIINAFFHDNFSYCNINIWRIKWKLLNVQDVAILTILKDIVLQLQHIIGLYTKME